MGTTARSVDIPVAPLRPSRASHILRTADYAEGVITLKVPPQRHQRRQRFCRCAPTPAGPQWAVVPLARRGCDMPRSDLWLV